PLPSGQITTSSAVLLALGLTAAGWSMAALSGLAAPGEGSTPAVIAGILVAAILLYDARLKRTPIGPIGMGACRFLNVLLGLTLAPEAMPWAARLHVAAAVGVYIVGVTWFARTEATQSNAGSLRGAALVILAGLLIALAVPVRVPPDTASSLYP